MAFELLILTAQCWIQSLEENKKSFSREIISHRLSSSLPTIFRLLSAWQRYFFLDLSGFHCLQTFFCLKTFAGSHFQVSWKVRSFNFSRWSSHIDFGGDFCHRLTTIQNDLSFSRSSILSLLLSF